MKIYVDELPNSCEECPMCRSGKLKLQRKGRYIEAEQCVFGQYKYRTIDDEIDTCPLQSLADYTKQVRKEVCEKIREWHDEEERNIDRLVENVENLCSNDLKPMWDKWHEEMTKQIKETIKGE